jgi:hypothetical protein
VIMGSIMLAIVCLGVALLVWWALERFHPPE